MISLILPLYNSERFLDELFESIKSQTYKDFELIILDDCSEDNTIDYLKKHNYKFYKNKKNLGFSKTVNKGIKLSNGDYICVLDHDVVYDKDYLRNLLKENKDIVCSKVYYYKQKNKIRALDIKINLFIGKSKIIGRDEIDNNQFNLKDINSLGISASMIKKDVFNKIGYLDEDFSYLYVDTDFMYRAKRLNYEIVSSEAKCWHKKQEKDNLTKEQLKIIYKDKKRFFKKHSPVYPFCMIPSKIKLILSTF